MAGQNYQYINRDPALFYWVLFPITIVMILTGMLRHYATVLLQSAPKPQTLAALREQRSLLRGINLRNNASAISPEAFAMRRDYLVTAYRNGEFLKEPENRGKPAGNIMSDPAAMDGMMGMMKSNMAMMIPQTLIMGWINAFFSGFVILKLPFPLTLQFKSMLQSGVMTEDLDAQWVSSLSWYFLNLFGLQPIFIYLLGDDNAANQMAQQMSQINPSSTSQMFQPGQDPDKTFLSEAENLEVMTHEYILDGVCERVLLLD